MTVVAIVPAFQAGPTVGAVVRDLLLAGAETVIVVDDGSTDDTAVEARAAGAEVVSHPVNRGKGAALRAGVATSTGRRVLLCDADLSTPIEDVERLEAELARAPVVLGSRALEASRITRRQPLHRELMGKVFNRIVRLLGVTGIRDTQCGFKLLDGDVARALFAELTIDRFAYDVELVWLARRRGHRVVETGVTWHDSPASKVHPLRDASRMLWDVLRFRFAHRGKDRRS